MTTDRRPILCSSFVADAAGEGSAYPSAGRDSADPAVQAIYWRCLAVEMTGARLFNLDVRLMVFSNIAPPTVDGVALGAVFDRLAVEVVRRPLTHRLPPGSVAAWGNVLYFLDILAWQRAHAPTAALLLLDGDVVVTGPLTTLFAELGRMPVVAYPLGSDPDEPQNGLSRRAMTALAARRFGIDPAGPVPHLGGELLGVAGARLADWLPAADALWSDMAAGDPAVAGVTTEEHMWSVLFPGLGLPVGDATRWIKRMWTDPRHNTVVAGDERRPLWHLPAEKRHGFVDAFRWCAARDFSPDLDPADFRAMALRAFGVPRASLGKVARDGARRVRRRLPARLAGRASAPA